MRHIEDLRKVMTQAKEAHPFSVVAMVVLPEHLHAIWRLPWGCGPPNAIPVGLCPHQWEVIMRLRSD